MSLDGKITKWDDVQDVSTWASPEDQDFFMSQIAKHKAIVMGRKTYDAMKDKLKLSNERLRIVMTSQSENFSKDEIKGKLEFTNETPQELVARLEKHGIEELLVVGGGSVNTAFLKANLVNEIYVTIEPVIFGNGKMIVYEENLNLTLRLKTVEKINQQGTILLNYTLNT